MYTHTKYERALGVLFNSIRLSQGISVREWRRHRKKLEADALYKVVRHLLRSPEIQGDPRSHGSTHMLEIAAAEYKLENAESFPVYFIDTPEMVDVLHRSKMSIDMESLEEFPEEFIVRPPRGTVLEGEDICACMVTWRTQKATFRHLSNFVDVATKGHVDMSGHIAEGDDTVKWLSIYSPHADGTLDVQHVYSSKLEAILKGEKIIGNKKTAPLNSLVVALLAYIQACPENVREGWPDKEEKIQLTARSRPFRVCLPAKVEKDKHQSPSMHWRVPHMRSYPMKKDGTRKKGVVFVHGTVVNPGNIDPQTVEEGKEPVLV